MDRCSAFGFMNPTRVKVMMCPVLESPNWHVCGAATRMLSGITRSSPAFKAFARTSLALSTCLYMVDWKVGSEGKNTCQSNIGTQGELLHSSTAMPWVTRCSTNAKLWQSDSITNRNHNHNHIAGDRTLTSNAVLEADAVPLAERRTCSQQGSAEHGDHSVGFRSQCLEEKRLGTYSEREISAEKLRTSNNQYISSSTRTCE